MQNFPNNSLIEKVYFDSNYNCDRIIAEAKSFADIKSIENCLATLCLSFLLIFLIGKKKISLFLCLSLVFFWLIFTDLSKKRIECLQKQTEQHLLHVTQKAFLFFSREKT
jgi:hypothetical protein